MKIIFTTTVLLFATSWIAFAQKTYTIDASGKMTPELSNERQPAYTFEIDKAFRGKTFEIYDGTQKNLVTLKGEKLDGAILSHNAKNDFTVRITDKHTVLECDGDCNNVTDDFTIMLDGKPYGPFSLTPVVSSEAERASAPEDTYVAGSMINDAIFIAENAKKGSKSVTIKKILAEHYFIRTSDDLTRNHFLKDDVSFAFKVIQGSGQSLKTLASSIGGLDVTTIADGFARFIVKRTKEELSVTFFQRFRDQLKQYKDLQTVFPKTYTLLLALDQQVYNYSSYINNLRESFRADLQTLDENLPGIIDNNKSFFDNNYFLGIGLRSGCYVSVSLRNEVHPGDLLGAYPLSFLDEAPEADKANALVIKGSMQLLQLLSESLKENDTTDRYWVGMDKIRKLVSDKLTCKIYIGLLLQTAAHSYNKIVFTGSETFYDKLNTAPIAQAFDKDYPVFRQYFTDLGSKVNALNEMVRDYEKPANDSIRVEQLAKYMKASAQLLNYSLKVTKLPYISDINALKNIDQKAQRYFEVVYKGSDLAVAINRKRYAEVVNVLLSLYSDVDASGSDSVMIAIARYGGFMSNLINAKDSREVAEAIEAAALPAGSSRIKRQSKFNVALNAYCGLYGGREVIKGLDSKNPFYRWNSFGLTAPIGISISKGNSLFPWPLNEIRRKKGPKGFSSSWFVSLVDLGTIAAFRFSNDDADGDGTDDTSDIPSIQLKDIFSPGLFYSVGIAKTPLSVNIGAQVGSNLRKVDVIGNTFADKSYVRYSLSVCVDIPVFNLYTKE